MPFIVNTKRPQVRSNPTYFCSEPGDRCFLIYEEMVRRWKLEARWKTADALHFEYVLDTEDNKFLLDLHSKLPSTGWNEINNAAQLAWQVFFQIYVMPYELKQRQANGDI